VHVGLSPVSALEILLAIFVNFLSYYLSYPKLGAALNLLVIHCYANNWSPEVVQRLLGLLFREIGMSLDLLGLSSPNQSLGWQNRAITKEHLPWDPLRRRKGQNNFESREIRSYGINVGH
jgi:hypothetical protein